MFAEAQPCYCSTAVLHDALSICCAGLSRAPQATQEIFLIKELGLRAVFLGEGEMPPDLSQLSLR